MTETNYGALMLELQGIFERPPDPRVLRVVQNAKREELLREFFKKHTQVELINYGIERALELSDGAIGLLFFAAELATQDGSSEAVGKVVAGLINVGSCMTAYELVRNVGRQFTPDEVRALGQAHLDHKVLEEDLPVVYDAYKNVLGKSGLNEFTALVAKQVEDEFVPF